MLKRILSMLILIPVMACRSFAAEGEVIYRADGVEVISNLSGDLTENQRKVIAPLSLKIDEVLRKLSPEFVRTQVSPLLDGETDGPDGRFTLCSTKGDMTSDIHEERALVDDKVQKVMEEYFKPDGSVSISVPEKHKITKTNYDPITKAFDKNAAVASYVYSYKLFIKSHEIYNANINIIYSASGITMLSYLPIAPLIEPQVELVVDEPSVILSKSISKMAKAHQWVKSVRFDTADLVYYVKVNPINKSEFIFPVWRFSYVVDSGNKNGPMAECVMLRADNGEIVEESR